MRTGSSERAGGLSRRGLMLLSARTVSSIALYSACSGVRPRRKSGVCPRRKSDMLTGMGNSNSHGARPVHQTISMTKGIQTSKLSTKNSLSARGGQVGTDVVERAHRVQHRALQHLFAGMLKRSALIGSGLAHASRHNTLVGPLWKGYHESRRCSGDTFPEP